MNSLKMCNQSMIFIVVSLVAFIYGIIQKCRLVNLGVFIVFIALWTMILNCICKMGMKRVSWIMVVLPYVMIFLFVSVFSDMTRVVYKEGANEGTAVVNGVSLISSNLAANGAGNRGLRSGAGITPAPTKSPEEKCRDIKVPGSTRDYFRGGKKGVNNKGGTKNDCNWNRDGKICQKTDDLTPTGFCDNMFKNLK